MLVELNTLPIAKLTANCQLSIEIQFVAYLKGYLNSFNQLMVIVHVYGVV